MAASQGQIIDFNSITVLGVNAISAVDRSEPLSFIQWLPYNKQTYTTPENSLIQYQSYLTDWYAVQNISTVELAGAVQNLYVNLINEIVLNYSTVEEQRYLSNLDVTNPRDLAIAVPFFSKKIKDICLYYTTLRETAQTATLQYNLKGSNVGVKTLLYNTISNALQSQDLTNTIATLNLSVSAIRNNMVLNIESIYDLTPDYFDINPTAPTSAYDTYGDIRETYFAANQVDIDPYLTLDLNQSIANAILKYPFFTSQLGTQLAITPAVTPTQLNFLKDADFINNVNTENAKDLTILTQLTEQQKYIGADYYYVITNSTGTSYTSGQLFTANSEFANVLNKRYPTIAAVPSQEFLKTGKEVGLFFKPDKIGLLHFTNFDFAASVNLNSLQPNTVYYFPDPDKYGNVTSNTQQNFVTPLEFFERNYFNKVDFSNQYRFGDVNSKPYHQLFRSYQSREQTLEYSDFGISRYTDYEDFFTGGLDTIWNNIDIFPLTPIEQYPVDQRTQELLTIDSTLFQFKSDIYGNQYGLYKPTSTIKKPLSSPYIADINISDLVIDSGTYSTTLSADTTINGGYLNPLSSLPTVVIQSYGFKYEAFTPAYVSSNFIISIDDCATFTAPTSTLWIDTVSQLNTYNSNQYGLYYNTLVECGLTTTGTAAYSGLTASFTYPTSGLSVYDGYWFLVDYYDNNLNLVREYDPFIPQQYIFDYTEPATFVTNRLSGLDTTIDFSLTGENIELSLYDKRNRTYGAIYCRTPDSSLIAPFSAALSSIYTKYTSITSQDVSDGVATIGDEINTECVNLDVHYDVLQIETSNYLIFDKIRYNYTNNTVPGSLTYSYIYRGDNLAYEKFSNTWFSESTNQLIFCQTKLYTTFINNIDPLSATNYKTVYPKIYVVDINSPKIIQIYPYTTDQNLPLSSVIQYSLSGTSMSTLDIIEVEKPVLSFNDTTSIYDLSYLCKDASNTFYTVNIKFKFINGVLTIVSETLYKPSNNALHQNFGTYGSTAGTYNTIILPTLCASNIYGAYTGFIDVYDSTFTYGVSSM